MVETKKFVLDDSPTAPPIAPMKVFDDSFLTLLKNDWKLICQLSTFTKCALTTVAWALVLLLNFLGIFILEIL